MATEDATDGDLREEDEAFAQKWYQDWSMCGCGDPVTMVEYLRDVMRYFGDRGDPTVKVVVVPDLPQHPTTLFFLYWLDSVGLTDHWTSVYGSWLTEEGKRMLAYLDRGTWRRVFDEGDD